MPDEPSAPVQAGDTALPYGMVELSDAECRELLERQRMCVVSVVDGEEPYAVPVFYGFDRETATLYLGVMEGRKTRALDANPRVCVVVTEVAPDDTWRSAIVSGVARLVSDPVERENAVRVLIAHNSRARRHATGVETAPRPRRDAGARGRLVRVEQATISGRAKR